MGLGNKTENIVSYCFMDLGIWELHAYNKTLYLCLSLERVYLPLSHTHTHTRTHTHTHTHTHTRTAPTSPLPMLHLNEFRVRMCCPDLCVSFSDIMPHFHVHWVTKHQR